MPQERLIPPPNWTSIFTLRPELDPPGYAETFIVMDELRPARKVKRAKGSNTRAVKKESRQATDARRSRARFPSLKHGAD